MLMHLCTGGDAQTLFHGVYIIVYGDMIPHSFSIIFTII